MEHLEKFLWAIRNLDAFLDQLTTEHGTWAYVVIGAIVFAETGLVVTPFLPGDSLLFACGAISMRPNAGLDPIVLGTVLIACAVAGDTVNYHVGKAIGPRVMKSDTSRWLHKRHLDKTHAFFEKYGGKTIILARFVPIVRTFAPFVAGAGAMNYRKFIVFNVVGAVAWVVSMMGAGMLFGQMEFVKKNFETVVIMIVLLSVMPMVIEYFKARQAAAKAATEPTADP